MPEDKSIEELSKSFTTKASLKKSQRFTSTDFDEHGEEVRDVAAKVQKDVLSKKEGKASEIIATNPDGKRLRTNGIASEQANADSELELYDNQGMWGQFVKVSSENNIAYKVTHTDAEMQDSEPPAKKSRSF